MNIFILHQNLTKNAQYHTNKHLVKMIVEQMQILCNAYYYTTFVPQNCYKPFNLKHPATLWVVKSLQNWLWLKQNTLALISEYEYRYQKPHKCKNLLLSLPLPQLPSIKRTAFVQIVPNELINKRAVTAYRNYYLLQKQHTFAWKNRPVPPFVKKYIKNKKSP